MVIYISIMAIHPLVAEGVLVQNANYLLVVPDPPMYMCTGGGAEAAGGAWKEGGRARASGEGPGVTTNNVPECERAHG